MVMPNLNLKMVVLLIGAAVIGLAGGNSDLRANEKVVVAVTAIEEHPALVACRNGIVDALKAAGYQAGKNLDLIYESAQGDLAKATQIARKFAKDKPNVIVPISTPSAQAVVSATIGTAVVFAAVTDPLGAKVVRDMFAPGDNVTGVSDLSPVEKHIDLIKQITPSARKIGVLFNPNESNSITLVYLMTITARNADMMVVEAPVKSPSEVQAAAQELARKSDVIFVPTDNTVVSMLDAVIKVGIDNQIPVYAGDIDSVSRGAIAAVGMDYYDIGWQTGAIVVRILKGEAPGKIPVIVADKTKLYVNPTMAAQMGVAIPEDIVSRADQVF